MRFLASLSETANIKRACERAGVGRMTVYDRRNNDPKFAAAMSGAIEEAVDLLEEEARRRALEDSDVLLIFLLKAHRPAVYRENVKIEHSGPNGKPIETRGKVTHDIASILAPCFDIFDEAARDSPNGDSGRVRPDGDAEPIHPPGADQATN